MNLIQFCNFSISSLTIFLKNAKIEHFQNWIRRQSREIRSEVVHVTSRDPASEWTEWNGTIVTFENQQELASVSCFSSSLGRIPVSGTRDFIILFYIFAKNSTWNKIRFGKSRSNSENQISESHQKSVVQKSGHLGSTNAGKWHACDNHMIPKYHVV